MPSVAARWAAWDRAGRRVNRASPLSEITFPASPLNLKAELALGADLTAHPSTWGWTDATAMIYNRDNVTISRGRADEAGVADTQKLNATANNRDGYWSTRDPSNPWYGLLRKGTPIRVFAEGYPRYAGFLAAIPPRWDISGEDRFAPFEAKGLLYRLSQGASPQRSPIKRTVLATDPDAYWPLEDGAGSTFLASGLSGGAPIALTTADATRIGIGGGLADGAGACIDLGIPGSSTSNPLSLPASSTWTISWVGRLYIPSSGSPAVMLRFLGPVVVYMYVIGQRVAAQVIGSGDTATVYTEVIAGDPDSDAQPHHVVLSLTQNGTDIDVQLSADGSVSTGGFPGAATVASSTNAVPTTLQLGSGTTAGITADTSLLFGHLALYASAYTGNLNSTPSALNAYVGELAHVRAGRLCDEESIPFTTGAVDSQAMGPQPTDSLVPLLRQCEATDQGFLYEDLDFGFTLQGHQERENQVATLALDYAVDALVQLEPTDDDQQARNDVEVKRDGGSSSRVVDMSLLSELSIPNIGRRDESVTYSLETDEQTYHLAGWRLRRGTFSGLRYPTLSMNLVAGPTLIPAVCMAGLGYRTTIGNPPDDVGPDDPSVIVEGYTETLALFDWDIQANCSLQGPWEVSVLAADTGDTDPHLGWSDWDSCELAADVTNGDTTWTVEVLPTDTTTADDFPRDVTCQGELVTVTACAGAVIDSFTRSSSNGWDSADSGQAWTVSGGTAVDFSVSGTEGIHAHTAAADLHRSVIAVGTDDMVVDVTTLIPFASATGGSIGQWVCVRYADNNNYYVARISVTTAGLVTLDLLKRTGGTLGAITTAITLATGHAATDYWRVVVQIAGSQLSAKAWNITTAEPGGWLQTVADTSLPTGTNAGLLSRFETGNTDVSRTVRWDNFDVLSARKWTVTRSANGISKAHAAGAPVSLAHPFVTAL